MNVIEFPESPKLRRLRKIIEVVQVKVDEINDIEEEINALMFEYELLQIQIAPFEVTKLLSDYYKISQQLEFHF
jgi:hypothetical protein